MAGEGAPMGPEQVEPGSAAETAREHTREALERTARVFRSVAQTARGMGEVDRAAELERLADEAEQHMAWGSDRAPGTLQPPSGGPSALQPQASSGPSAVQPQSSSRPPRPAESGGPLRSRRAAPGTAMSVLLVDDHELAREALRSVLTPEQGFNVVGEAADGQHALWLAHQLRPELVLMDIRMPGMDGLATTRALLAELPATTVVVLTSYEQRPIVLDALRAGAAAYLLKGASKQEVLATLRAAMAGERRVQSSLAADLLAEDACGTGPELVQSLSQREVEVVRLMAAGQSNVEIARSLQVSLNTVKTHVQRVLRKLDAVDRASAVTRAAALGLLVGGGAPDCAEPGPA
jgi:DNA-binding NarL/FixJ family response regulator